MRRKVTMQYHLYFKGLKYNLGPLSQNVRLRYRMKSACSYKFIQNAVPNCRSDALTDQTVWLGSEMN